MTTATPLHAKHTGPEGLPQWTLGWRVLEWMYEYLVYPDGPDVGEPLKLTPEQARFVLWWYAIDERGKFQHRYGVYRRMKGAGKTPLAAAICCVEFLGPCRFGGWDKGEPVVVEHEAAWVQAAAYAHDQTRNMMTLFPGMISPQAVAEYQVDIGKEIIYALQGRRRLEAVSSSARSLEGQRPTMYVKDETHHWRQVNGGHAMSATISRNVAKSRDGSARVLATTNAHAPGEDSDAERDYEAYLALVQSGRPLDILYDSLEAPEDLDFSDDDSLRAGVLAARGDSHWLDVDRILAEIRDTRTTESMARRYYLNQIFTSDDRPFDAQTWDGLADPHVVPPGALITLGFDGSRGGYGSNYDHTALIGTEVATGYQWVVGYWVPQLTADGELRIDADEVEATIDEAFARWKVWRLNADPYYWSDRLSVWAGRYGDRVYAWATNMPKRMAIAVLHYQNAIDQGALSHDGDPRFRASIVNAVKHQQAFVDDAGEPMYTIEKEHHDSPLKIDAAMAAILSHTAADEAKKQGALNEVRSDLGNTGIPGVWS